MWLLSLLLGREACKRVSATCNSWKLQLLLSSIHISMTASHHLPSCKNFEVRVSNFKSTRKHAEPHQGLRSDSLLFLDPRASQKAQFILSHRNNRIRTISSGTTGIKMRKQKPILPAFCVSDGGFILRNNTSLSASPQQQFPSTQNLQLEFCMLIRVHAAFRHEGHL